ncbi:indolepyruvate ferredoxin oxidoreductase family protein [Sphingopyxis kveilinensis]|uniref:indolepyruvate ferredoxin oxidoreductase family protein n=1 Tax=Sphingopyxis kveilinensis TaxID=3114367 RepID=UPI0030CCABBE
MIDERPLQAISLDDKYSPDAPSFQISGVQALVRLLIEQARRDRSAGLRTAGYVSGYRGSPLGTVDSEMRSASRYLDEANVRFEFGVNEDLAATAIIGTQQIDVLGDKTVDGVFSLWYGKGPGVDRSGDAFRHGNRYGTSEHGGVLLAFGDDHPGKSSTVANQSEHALAAIQIPILYPATIAEIVQFGLHGWALSRYSGLWTALKIINETADASAIIKRDDLAIADMGPTEELSLPEGGIHYTGRFSPQRDEEIVTRYRLPRVHEFARANGLNRIVINPAKPRLCIVAAGKSYLDVRQALKILGVEEEAVELLGIRLLKVGMIWPLEPRIMIEAAAGCEEILVIEEKRSILEEQIAQILYNAGQRPRLVGKQDEKGSPLLHSDAQVEPGDVARVIAQRLAALGEAAFEARALDMQAAAQTEPVLHPGTSSRVPYFCSGCPHNSSTKVPEGSIALSGIGCHSMAMWMKRETDLAPVQMGAEGANWIGASPFVRRKHVFQNLGDGTYSHSGLLAIRAAAVSKTPITYKILFNDAVAMTGGQSVEGELSIGQVARQVLSEGVLRCVVVSDNPEAAMQQLTGLPVSVHHRSKLDEVQDELRAIDGTTVLIFEQVCAAEKRRRRKRNLMPDPDRRIFINEAVCEGCGDCSKKSNCVSVLPKETALGRKREIDQSSCNKDFSCVEGFCPSFVSISGGALRKRDWPSLTQSLSGEMPEPERLARQQDYSILITGIGGTGVITIAAILAMAANIEGRGATTYNMTGLAQKGGSVYSHVRFSAAAREEAPVKIGRHDADLIIGCDLVVTGGKDALATIAPARTYVVLNSHLVPTAGFQAERDFDFGADALMRNIAAAAGEERIFAFDAHALATMLFSDSIAANMLMVGAAYQRGRLPVGADAIENAIRLNRVSVDLNIAAFRIGRAAVARPADLAEKLQIISPPKAPIPEGFDDILAHRQGLLRAYQNQAYADRYAAIVNRLREREQAVVPGRSELSVAAAKNLYKLMAYKDEYEVARLYRSPEFKRSVEQIFAGNYKMSFHLAPPIAAFGKEGEAPRKRQFGPWIYSLFGLLAKLKFLRGTGFDPFGYSAERRQERLWIERYGEDLGLIGRKLSARNYMAAIALAKVPEQIRGYGPVKLRALRAAEIERETLLPGLG